MEETDPRSHLCNSSEKKPFVFFNISSQDETWQNYFTTEIFAKEKDYKRQKVLTYFRLPVNLME